MKVAVIIPTRGDRPQFIKQCKNLLQRQTRKPDKIFWMDYKPESKAKDITQRIRRGIEKATNEGFNVAIFWEDDDWYHPTYLEWLLGEWKRSNMPAIFGVGETYYYNIAVNGRLHMKHGNRTSLFCTMMNLPFMGKWCSDSYPYLDMHLHKTGLVKTVNFPKDEVKAIGIKHGIGLCGGGGHNARFKWDMTGSAASQWFSRNMDDQLSFYQSLLTNVNDKKILKSRPSIKKIIPTQNTERNNARITRKNTSSNTNPQLQRRSTKIIKIRRK